MTARASEWIARGEAILAELRRFLASYGLHVDPALRVSADLHPCPGYLHEARVIAFCPPIVEDGVDRLRWAFFAPYMGCASVEEAAQFYDAALPFVIAHETTHHLRISRGLDAGSHFVEEQVCDRVAAAIVTELDVFSASLRPLQERCAMMRRALAPKFGGRPTAAFVPDAAALAVDPVRLARLRRITAREGLSYTALVALVPELDARDLAEAELARDRARAHLDLHYTRDPAEYWYASVVWLERYLEGDERPGFIEMANAHLSTSASADPAWITAVEEGLRADDALVVEGAAATLGESFGDGVIEDLVDHAVDSARHPFAIVRALSRGATPPRRAAERLIRRLAPRVLEAEDARLLLRLSAVADVARDEAIVAARRVATAPALEAELLAAEERGEDRLVFALLDPDRTGDVLEALVAHGRRFGVVPEALLTNLPRRGTRRWRQMLTILPREELPAINARAAALRIDLGLAPAPEALDRALEVAGGACLWAARLPGDDPVTVVARDALLAFARRSALDVALARAKTEEAPALAEVAALVEGASTADPVLLDIASDGDATIRALLTGVGAGPIDRDALPPLALAAADRASGYAAHDDVRMLLDHLIRLRAVPMFVGLTAEQLAELARHAMERTHDAGEIIVREGERGDELHVLLEGEISIVRGDVTLATLRPPSCFGEMAIFDGAPRSASAVAATACRLLSLEGDAIRRAGRRDPSLYEALLRVMTQRLREAGARDRAR